MNYPALVTIQLGFTTLEEPEQLAERIREAVAAIVGRDSLEEFRWKSLPIEPGPGPGS